MKIAVVGSGYVGLVVGTCFAETGNRIHCVDVDEDKIACLRSGEVPIYEPGLEELIERNVAEGRLQFSTDVAGAIRASKVVFIAVGTPPGEDGSADLRHVLAVARSIGEAMDGYRVVVLKSTVPVGTNQAVTAEIARHTSHPFDVVNNPEFLKEGAAIDDFMKPDRVVLGSTSEQAIEVMKELYQPFVRTGKPILTMDPASAEMTKYAANAMLATRISFMNEMSQICERVGADVDKVRQGIATDSRIGHAFLFAGVGYGGSCFPKDVHALVKTAEQHGYTTRIINAVQQVNDEQKKVLFKKIHEHFGGELAGKRFAVWGLAFKPNTDDMREAPSVVLIEELFGAGAEVVAFDPEAMDEARHILGDRLQTRATALEALDGADALVLVTEWNEFRHVDPDDIRARLKSPVVFDGRNIFLPNRMRRAGFDYHGVGIR